jgi:hypothetical protein
MALNDYLSDETELNLKLFIMSVNSLFSLTAKKRPELVALINKYKADNSKLRLQAIESYLGATAVQKKKIEKIKKEIDIPVVNRNSPEKEILLTKLEELRQEFLQNLSANSPSTINRQIEIKKEMHDIELELEMATNMSNKQMMYMGSDGDKENKLAIFTSIFGDYNQPGTAAWSLVNKGGMTQFSITDSAFAGMWFNTEMNKPSLDKFVFEVTGKKMIPYQIVENKTTSPSQWIFSLQAVSINRYIKDSDGKQFEMGLLDKMTIAEKI